MFLFLSTIHRETTDQIKHHETEQKEKDPPRCDGTSTQLNKWTIEPIADWSPELLPHLHTTSEFPPSAVFPAP